MADQKNASAQNKAENKAEMPSPPPPPPPAPQPKGFWNSSFWKSPWGTALLIASVAFVLPMDEVMSEIVEPGLGLADRVRRLLTIRIERAGRSLRRAANHQLWASIFVAIVCAAITFIGVANRIRVVAAFGPALWGAYIVWLRIKIGAGLSAVSYLAGTGVELGGTLLGKVLRSAGLSTMMLGDDLRVGGKKLSASVGSLMMLMALFTFAAGGLLFLAPNWLSLGLFFGGFITVCATGTAAVYLGKSVHVGIELIYRWSYRLVIVEVIYGLLIELLPKTMGSLGNRTSGLDKWLDAWLSDPTFPSFGPVAVLIAIALLGIVALALSGYHGTTNEGKSKAYAMIGKGAFYGLPAVLVLMLFTGAITWPGVKGAVKKAWYGPEYTVGQESADRPQTPDSQPMAKPAVPPATGTPNELEPPSDTHVPPLPVTHPAAPPIPETDPVDTAKSLTDKTDIELLTE